MECSSDWRTPCYYTYPINIMEHCRTGNENTEAEIHSIKHMYMDMYMYMSMYMCMFMSMYVWIIDCGEWSNTMWQSDWCVRRNSEKNKKWKQTTGKHKERTTEKERQRWEWKTWMEKNGERGCKINWEVERETEREKQEGRDRYIRIMWCIWCIRCTLCMWWKWLMWS